MPFLKTRDSGLRRGKSEKRRNRTQKNPESENEEGEALDGRGKNAVYKNGF